MKKLITLILLALICLQVPSYALETFELKLVDYKVVINDVTVDTNKNQYPMVSYENVTYLPMTYQNVKALGLNLKFDLGNVFISKNEELPIGYSNGEEVNIFPKTISAVLAIRNLYINDNILENNKEKHPIFEYKGVLYLPMSDSLAKELLGINFTFNEGSGLRINSKLIVDTVETEKKVEVESKVAEVAILDTQIKNKKLIEDALALEKSIISRLKNTNPTRVYDGAKEYTFTSEGSKVLGLYKWTSGDIYAGEFKNGKFDGIGVYTWSSGQKYVGEFKNSDFNGIGRYYYTKESRSKITNFKNGLAIDDAKVYTERPVEYSKNQKVLVILTEFKNLKLRTTEDDWKEFMFGSGNSVREYYKNESLGNLKFEPATESEGVYNDGIVRVRLDYFHPDFDQDYQNSFSITRDSLEKANAFIDFEKYDTNGNGNIDKNELTIVNVVAGYEYVKNVNLQSIYAHRGTILKGNTIFDDTDVVEYVMIGELHYNKNEKVKSYMSTIGITVHEMGHAYGLPDLYDTDYSSNGIGPFGIMGTGIHEVVNGGKPGEKPIEMSAWSKFRLGFVKPTTVKTNGIYDLYTSKTGKYNNLKIDLSNSEYLLIENKNYDKTDNVLNKDGLESGVLIWRVNNKVINNNYFDNIVNNDEKNKGVDLIESDELTLKYSKLDSSFKDRNFYPFFQASGISHYEVKINKDPKISTSKAQIIMIDILGSGDLAKAKVTFK